MSFANVQMKIIQWAEARKIIPYAKPHTQLMKAVSEMGELCDAELKGDMDGIKDGLADVMICLINYAALKDVDLVECLKGGYEEIKHRSGRMTPDGTFVKDK
jgi:NTP pyrophosphatase (non-canonical NTP hydrolase)